MQLSFPTLDYSTASVDAVDLLSEVGREERGGVYTKREVVDFILDLVGYTSEQDLTQFRLLEPSCGEGDFIVVAVERLLISAQLHDISSKLLTHCIKAIEVSSHALGEAKLKVESLLCRFGYNEEESNFLIESWFEQADFLMLEHSCKYTHIVGNPPYVRQEDLPKELLQLYRKTYSTMYDRADLYVPFFERGLELLEQGGRFSFICSDRWMKNKYGGPLRKVISSAYHLDCYVDMTGCPAFDKEVVAYPAVTVISKSNKELTRASYRPPIDAKVLTKLVPALRDGELHPDVVEATQVVSGAEPWLLDDFQRLNVIRKVESQFDPIEQQGCKVSIGVATGADKVYISKDLDLEPVAQLPLVTTKDILKGEIEWQGKYVVNPYEEDGRLLSLPEHPKLAAHIEANEEIIRNRNVAKKNPKKWYKTIDRIYPSLQHTPMLLIPDIKGEANVVYDKGEYYPHHNLYYIISNEWDLEALQAVLLSQVAQAFVATYSLRMRGDCLRYQAQYLRRIRLPQWSSVSEELRKDLITAARKKDMEGCNRAARILYNLDEAEFTALIG